MALLLRNCCRLLSLCVLILPLTTLAGKRLDVKGRVSDAEGEPLAGAAVYVFTAQPKDGKALVCPSCYPDCSKQATTDASGKFVLPALDSDLDFRLLAVAKGYLPRYIRDVDPEVGNVEASLKGLTFPKAARDRRITGKLIGPEGKPVAGAILEVEGARHGPYSFTSSKGMADPVTATDEKGEFLFTCKDELKGLLVTLKPRGLARRRQWLEVGQSYLLRITTGVTLKGRLLNNGRPMSELTLTLTTQDRSMDNYLGNIEIATDEEGRFTLEHLPSNNSFWLTTQMKEVSSQGITLPPTSVKSGADGSSMDLGDVQMKPAFKISGRIILSDGKPVPDKVRLSVSVENSSDSHQVEVDDEGEFEIGGVPATGISLWLRAPGSHVSAKNPNKDWLNEGALLGVLSKSLEDFIIHLEPGDSVDRSLAPPDSERYPRDKPLRGAKVP